MTVVTGIPTLGSELFITKPQAKITYVLKYYAVAPLSMSNTHYTQSISLGDRLSEYGGNATSIIEPVREDITTELKRVFPEATAIDVDVTATQIEDTRYKLNINPSVTINNLTYYVERSVTIHDGVLITSNDTVTNS